MGARGQKAKLLKRGKDKKWIVKLWEDIYGLDGLWLKRSKRTHTLGLVRKMSRRRAQVAADLIASRVNPDPSQSFGRKQGKTLREAVEDWREHYSVRCKASTVRAADSHLDQHIQPKLGTFDLKDITRRTVQEFITAIAKTGIHGKTISNIVGTLSSVLDSAREVDESVPDIRTFSLKIPRTKPSRVPRWLSSEQARLCVDHAKKPYDTISAVYALTGVRGNEALGLKVDDLDFNQKLIYIRRSLDVRTRLETTPKTPCSMNTVPIPPELERRLLAYLKDGYRENSNNYLFVNRNLRPYSLSKFVEYGIWPVADKFSFKRCGTHAFRHGLATGLLDAHVPITQVQRQLRQKDLRTTLRYVHSLEGSHCEALNSYARKFENVGPLESSR